MPQLSEELEARNPRLPNGARKPRPLRITEFETAARASRQISILLRNLGVSEDANRFAYRSQVLQRNVLHIRRNYLRALGSWFLDLISGNGYKPMRSFLTYLIAVGAFAVAYYLLGNNVNPPMDPLSAVVFSDTSFHGRGFVPSENMLLNNPLTVIAAGEAIIGLLIEIVFIATFT